MHRVALLLAVAAVAGCGGSSSPKHAATAPAVPGPAAAVGSGAKTLYRGGGWAVVVDEDGSAVALHRSGVAWRPDRSGRVKIEILGPRPASRAAATPQVAVQLSASSRLVESAIWVDGRELLVKGGGGPTRGTIYGAPDAPLTPGTHRAVAYGRTASAATAVAWTFRVG